MDMNKEPIPAQYAEFIEVLGMDGTMKLCERFGGGSVYIPKTDSLKRYIRRRKIRQEFNGCNAEELAQKYRLSRRWIRKVLSENA